MQYKHFSTKFIYLNNQGTLKAQLNYANGASSSLVAHLARKAATCTNGKITIFGE